MPPKESLEVTIRRNEEESGRHNCDMVKLRLQQIKCNLIFGYLECSDVTNNFDRAKILKEHLNYLDGIIMTTGSIPFRFFKKEVKVEGINFTKEDHK